MLKKEINLENVKDCCEKVLALLKEDQHGLMTWNMFLSENLERLSKELVD